MVATKASQLMTNIFASPSVKNPIGESGGVLRAQICRYSTVAADGAGDIIQLCILDATDRVTSIKVWNTADAGMTTVDVGIYTPQSQFDTTVAPTAIDADGLVVDADLHLAAAVPTELLGLGNTNQVDLGKALWEYCPGGPATIPTPGTKYLIAAAPGGNPAGGGDYTFLIQYIAGA